MLKATTSAFAAALLAASCTMAMAQGAGTDKTEGSEAGPGRPASEEIGDGEDDQD